MLGAAGLATAFASSVAETSASTITDVVFDVKDFGAKGDGKSPDSESIQKALDAAASTKGIVFFPPGIYLCHDLKVPEQVCLKCEPTWEYRGTSGTILQLDSDEADCVLDVTHAFGSHIYGLLLRGNRNASKEIHGIYLNNPKNYSSRENAIVIDDCKVQEFSGNGVYLKRIWLFIIRHSLFHSNKKSGVLIQGWDGFVTDNQFSGNGEHGFGTENVGATVMFTANRVEWNRGYGLYLKNGDTWNVTGNCFDRNWGAGLFMNNITAASVTGNVFRRCGKDSAALQEGKNSCQVYMDNCSGVTVTGNSCLAGRDDGGQGTVTPEVGFLIRKLTNVVISSNVLHRGYNSKSFEDLGEHGEGFIQRDNVGSPVK